MNGATDKVVPRPARPGRWWWKPGLSLAAPAAVLLLAEVLLRAVGYGHSTAYWVPHPSDASRWVDNPHFGERFFPAGLLRLPPPASIVREKASGTIRVLVFGESAVMGDPKPAYGVARYLEVLLRDRHPGAKFEVIPVAMTAVNSHALLAMARDSVALGADYWIIHAGNNEMLGPFGAGRTMGGISAPWPMVRLMLAAKSTRLAQVFEAAARRLRGASGPAISRWTGTRAFANESIPRDDPRRTRVYDAFRHNLRDLVRAGQTAGARVMVSSVAVNLSDCGPFGAGAEPAVDEARREVWRRGYEQGRHAVTNGEARAGLAALGQAASIGDGHAGLQFLRGTALLALTNRAEALAAFSLARDLDTIPLRADSRLDELARAVATETGAAWVDAAGEFARVSNGGVPGREFFYEHVHFVPEGSYALARVFADALSAELPAAVRATAQGEWATPETCATRLALTPWNRSQALETMLYRCLEAPFTNRLDQDRQILALGADLARWRRAQSPDSARFVRGIYTNAIGAAPDDPHLRRVYAEFLEAVGDGPESIAQWRRVTELLPQHPFAYLQAGALLRRTGKLDDARPLIERAVALQPDWIEARLELADLLVARGRPGDAVVVCREALRLQPDHARAHLRLADALAADKQRDAAVRSLEEAVRLDPGLWEARYLLGVEYALQDRIDPAREQFEAVIRSKPDHALARFNLGIAYARQQRWTNAADHLAEAIRLDPKNEDAKQAFAKIVMLLRKSEGAVGSPKAPGP